MVTAVKSGEAMPKKKLDIVVTDGNHGEIAIPAGGAKKKKKNTVANQQQMIFASWRRHINITRRSDLATLQDLCTYNRELLNASLQFLLNYYHRTGLLLSSVNLETAMRKDKKIWPFIQSLGARSIIKIAGRQFRHFMKIKETIKDENDYRYSAARFPFMVPENELFPVIFANTDITLKDGYYFNIPLSRAFKLKHKESSLDKLQIYIPDFLRLPTLEATMKKIKEVRILPRYGGFHFFAEFSYEHKEVRAHEKKSVLLQNSQAVPSTNKVLIKIIDDDTTFLNVYRKNKIEFSLDKANIIEIQQEFHYCNQQLLKIYKKQKINGATQRLADLCYERDKKINNVFIEMNNKLLEFLISQKIELVEIFNNFINTPRYPVPRSQNRFFLELLKRKCRQNAIVFLEDA